MGSELANPADGDDKEEDEEEEEDEDEDEEEDVPIGAALALLALPRRWPLTPVDPTNGLDSIAFQLRCLCC